MYNNRDKIDADTVKKFFDRYGEVVRVAVYVNDSYRDNSDRREQNWRALIEF